MYLADVVASGPIPLDFLAPFPAEDQQMIQQEAAADLSFARELLYTLGLPGGAQSVAQSARKAIANELNPNMYPETVGSWPLLRKMTDDLAASTVSNVKAQVDSMSLTQLVSALKGISAKGKSSSNGVIGGFGAALPPLSSTLSTLSVVGGLAAGLVQAGASIYTAHVMASTTKQVAQIQASVMINNANVQAEVAQAQAAMTSAQATINAQQIQEQQIQLQQQQLALQQQQLAAQQAQQPPAAPAPTAPTPDQTSVDSSITASASVPSPGPQPSVVAPPTPPPPPPPPMQSSPVTTLAPLTPDQSQMQVQPPQIVPVTAPMPGLVPVTSTPAPAGPNLVLPIAIAGGAGAVALIAHHFLSDMPGGRYIGQFEIQQFNKLSKPVQKAIIMESEDPAFVTGYLIQVLRGPDPEKRILADIHHEVHMADMYGMGYLGKSFWKKVVKAIKKVTISLPVKVLKWTTPKAVQQIAKKIGKPIMKVWHKFGPIIIGVVGGVLALFTGGASLAAAAVLSAALSMYTAKKAAAKALTQNKQAAGIAQGEADQQQAQVEQQVDAFYQQNQQWFLNADITPASWATLTLDQKISIINAGATGTLPPGTVQVGTVNVPPSTTGISYGQPGWTPPPGYAIPTPPPPSSVPDTNPPPPPQASGSSVVPPPPPASNAPQSPGITSTAGAPTNGGPTDVPTDGSSSTSGGGGGGSYGGAESTDTGSTPGQAAQQINVSPDGTSTGTTPTPSAAPSTPPPGYTLVVEGQTLNTYAALSDATTAALAATQPGNRFQFMYNGQSTGLWLRTSAGATQISAADAPQVLALTPDQSAQLAASEVQAATAPTGGAPSLLVPGIIAGVLAVGAVVLGGGKKS